MSETEGMLFACGGGLSLFFFFLIIVKAIGNWEHRVQQGPRYKRRKAPVVPEANGYEGSGGWGVGIGSVEAQSAYDVQCQKLEALQDACARMDAMYGPAVDGVTWCYYARNGIAPDEAMDDINQAEAALNAHLGRYGDCTPQDYTNV